MPRKKPAASKDGQRRSAVQQVRHDIARVNRPVPRVVETILLTPKEFASRIRENIHQGRNPTRLVRCLDDIETELQKRGIRMPAYFESLRKSARRALAEPR